MLCFSISFGGERERRLFGHVVRDHKIAVSAHHDLYYATTEVDKLSVWDSTETDADAAVRIRTVYILQLHDLSWPGCGGTVACIRKARHGSSRGGSSPTDVMSTLKKSGVQTRSYFKSFTRFRRH